MAKDSIDPSLLQVNLEEYSKLKDEQISRIGFRDNLLYVTLIVFGGIISFALSSPDHIYSFLVLPWSSIILGWTYLMNDEKISSIGNYIHNDLAKRIKNKEHENIFGWESYHQSDRKRKRRKLGQLAIDLITFIFSGIGSIIIFLLIAPSASMMIKIIVGLELLLLFILGFEIISYAKLGSKKERS